MAAKVNDCNCNVHRTKYIYIAQETNNPMKHSTQKSKQED